MYPIGFQENRAYGRHWLPGSRTFQSAEKFSSIGSRETGLQIGLCFLLAAYTWCWLLPLFSPLGPRGSSTLERLTCLFRPTS